jgi:hypothetical protein
VDRVAPRIRIAAPRLQRREGRNVYVTLTCDERCFVAGLSRGAKAKPRQRPLPGVPTRQTIRLSREDTRIAYERTRRRGHATLALAITVKDRTGNQVTRGFAIRIVP